MERSWGGLCLEEGRCAWEKVDEKEPHPAL